MKPHQSHVLYLIETYIILDFTFPLILFGLAEEGPLSMSATFRLVWFSLPFDLLSRNDLYLLFLM